MTEAIIAVVFTLLVLAVLAALIVPRVMERLRLDGRFYHHHRYHEVPR